MRLLGEGGAGLALLGDFAGGAGGNGGRWMEERKEGEGEKRSRTPDGRFLVFLEVIVDEAEDEG